MLTKELLQALPVERVLEIRPVSGGDINETYKIITAAGDYFLKVQRNANELFFKKEANGLMLLSKAVRTPAVIEIGEIGSDAYLLLEWIDSGPRDDEKLGAALVSLHSETNNRFGLIGDNFIGKLPQCNKQNEDWASFYIECRLIPQVKMAKGQGLWNLRREKQMTLLMDKITNTYKRLSVIPRLLHGDLWSGNIMFAKNGDPVFIDPAVSYGNREMDIAMTRLFGGFGHSFYERYEELLPLDKDWQERISWYQLYYLLVHLNLFGAGYGSAVDRALQL